MKKIKKLLSEPSTIIGIFMIAAAFGSIMIPSMTREIISVTITIGGALGFAMSERNKFSSESFFDWLKARLREPSSRISLAMILGVVGINISPDHFSEIMNVVTILGGAMGIATAEGSNDGS